MRGAAALQAADPFPQDVAGAGTYAAAPLPNGHPAFPDQGLQAASVRDQRSQALDAEAERQLLAARVQAWSQLLQVRRALLRMMYCCIHAISSRAAVPTHEAQGDSTSSGASINQDMRGRHLQVLYRAISLQPCNQECCCL